jgi:transposase
MMGQLSSGQDRLFYSFNLEDHIPTNHLLRSIDRCLDLSDLRLLAVMQNCPTCWDKTAPT